MTNTHALVEEITTLQEQVKTAYLRTRTSLSEHGFSSEGLDTIWDEEHWELSLKLRETIAAAVKSADRVQLVNNTAGEITELVSVATFGTEEVILYSTKIWTKNIEQYTLADNGRIDWFLPGNGALYVG